METLTAHARPGPTDRRPDHQPRRRIDAVHRPVAPRQLSVDLRQYSRYGTENQARIPVARAGARAGAHECAGRPDRLHRTDRRNPPEDAKPRRTRPPPPPPRSPRSPWSTRRRDRPRRPAPLHHPRPPAPSRGSPPRPPPAPRQRPPSTTHRHHRRPAATSPHPNPSHHPGPPPRRNPPPGPPTLKSEPRTPVLDTTPLPATPIPALPQAAPEPLAHGHRTAQSRHASQRTRRPASDHRQRRDRRRTTALHPLIESAARVAPDNLGLSPRRPDGKWRADRFRPVGQRPSPAAGPARHDSGPPHRPTPPRPRSRSPRSPQTPHPAVAQNPGTTKPEPTGLTLKIPSGEHNRPPPVRNAIHRCVPCPPSRTHPRAAQRTTPRTPTPHFVSALRSGRARRIGAALARPAAPRRPARRPGSPRDPGPIRPSGRDARHRRTALHSHRRHGDPTQPCTPAPQRRRPGRNRPSRRRPNHRRPQPAVSPPPTPLPTPSPPTSPTPTSAPAPAQQIGAHVAAWSTSADPHPPARPAPRPR